MLYNFESINELNRRKKLQREYLNVDIIKIKEKILLTC